MANALPHSELSGNILGRLETSMTGASSMLRIHAGFVLMGGANLPITLIGFEWLAPPCRNPDLRPDIEPRQAARGGHP
jgi:hypothetical protein